VATAVWALWEERRACPRRGGGDREPTPLGRRAQAPGGAGMVRRCRGVSWAVPSPALRPRA